MPVVDEELLDTGPRRRVPSTAWVVFACVLVIGAAALVGSRNGDTIAGRPAASTPSPHASLRPPVAVPVTPLIPVSNDAPAVELDGQIITAAGGTIGWTSLDGSAEAGRLDHNDDRYALVADPSEHRVWTVRLTGSPEVGVYDSRGPSLELEFPFDGRPTDAALLDGHLYVTADTTLYRVDATVDAPGNTYTIMQTPVRGASAVTADPTRHRLLLLDLGGTHASVRAQQPSDARPQATAILPFGKGAVSVAGDAIWAAGYGEHGAVLARLDPANLRVVEHSPLEVQLGAGANVVAADKSVLFVRGDANRGALWCIDARSGAVLESYVDAPGAVALGPDGGYLLPATGAPPTKLTGGLCAG